MTAEEVKQLYSVFPITIGFRKYRPVNEGHLRLLEAFGLNMGSFFIVGDFIAGNWRAARCRALGKGRLCYLHSQGLKPIQCVVVPFCAIFPEDIQHLVIAQRRQETFSRCEGFKPDSAVVWSEGSFINTRYREAFYRYQQALMYQRDFMVKALKAMRGNLAYRRFLQGEGILEMPISAGILDDFSAITGLSGQEVGRFITAQRQLYIREAEIKGESIFADALTMPPYSDTINTS